MNREDFISLYRQLLNGDGSRTNVGIILIREYIEELGSEEQKQYSELFLNLILNIPPLYNHCLTYVIDYYVNKLSVVKLIKTSPNGIMGEQIISVY